MTDDRLGLPLCRMVGLVCLGSGAVLHAAGSREASPYSNRLLNSLRVVDDTTFRIYTMPNGVHLVGNEACGEPEGPRA